MDITAFIKTLITPDFKKLDPKEILLKTGDRITGSVVSLKEDGTVLVDFGKFRAFAEIRFPVNPGDRLPLRVSDIGSQLKFQLDTTQIQKSAASVSSPVSTESLGRVYQSIISEIDRILTPDTRQIDQQPLPVQIKEALSLIRQQLSPIIVTDQMDFLVSQLKSAVENSGIYFEKKISDLLLNSKSAELNKAPDSLSKTSSSQTDSMILQTTASGLEKKPEKDVSDKPVSDTNRFFATPAQQSDFSKLTLEIGRILTSQPGQLDIGKLPPQIQVLLIELADRFSSQPANQQLEAAVSDLQRIFTDNNTINLTNLEKALFIHLQFKEQHDQPANGQQELRPETPVRQTDTDFLAMAGRKEIKALIRSDLKPNIDLVRQFLEITPDIQKSMDMKAAQRLMAGLEYLTNEIERQQEQAGHRKQGPEPFQIISHAIPVKDQDTIVNLHVYYPKRRKGIPAHPKISMLLDMDRLGPVRTDLTLINSDLNITFFVDQEKIKSEFEANLNEICERLAGRFNHLGVNVVVSRQKIAQFNDDPFLPVDGKLLDIQA